MSRPAEFGALWRVLVKIPTMTSVLRVNTSVWIIFSVQTPDKWLKCHSGGVSDSETNK